MFFSVKSPIEWAIKKLSTIILKISNKWHFNEKFKIKSSQYVLLIAGFDQNNIDIRYQWWKLIKKKVT